MSSHEFKPPKHQPSQRSHLERLVGQYGRAHGISAERTRRWLSVMSFIGALDGIRLDDGPRFLVKGGVSMELRLGLRVRATKDLDIVFRGDPGELLDALDEVFARPRGRFDFRRKGAIEEIRDTGSRRFSVQVSFAGRNWQTLQLEVAAPEADEIELVPVAVDIADFGLEGPSRVACLSLRFQVAQKLHAVTEQPPDRPNLRYWDLIDLMLLRNLLADDLRPTRCACVATFSARAAHAWPPTLTVPDRWAAPYRTTVEEIGLELPGDVEAAASEIRALISQIDSAS